MARITARERMLQRLKADNINIIDKKPIDNNNTKACDCLVDTCDLCENTSTEQI